MKLTGKNGYVRDVTDADILELSMHPRDVDKRHSEYLGWESYHEHVVNTFHSSVETWLFALMMALWWVAREFINLPMKELAAFGL